MASTQNIDFSNVKDGGGQFSKKRLPEGDYLATIVKVDDAKAKDDTFQYLFTIKLDKVGNATYPYYCKLQENQLWKLRNIFIAAGKAIPKKKLKVDPNQIVGKKVGVTLSDTEYNNQEQSEIDGIFPASELTDEGPDVDDDTESTDEAEEDVDIEDMTTEAEPEADEEEAEEEPEAEEEEDEDDGLDALDRTALKAKLKANDPSFVAKKSQSDDDLRALLRGADNNPEKPSQAPARSKVAQPRKAGPAKPAADVSDEELEELDIDNL